MQDVRSKVQRKSEIIGHLYLAKITTGMQCLRISDATHTVRIASHQNTHNHSLREIKSFLDTTAYVIVVYIYVRHKNSRTHIQDTV